MSCLEMPHHPRTEEEKQKHFQNMIGKWKDLRHLKMAPVPWNLEEILTEISKHCEHFLDLEMSGGIGWEQISAIVTLLAKVRQLHLTGSFHLQGTPAEHTGRMQRARGTRCEDFWVDVDDKLLEMAAHIKRFECSGFIPEEDIDNSHIYGLYNSDGSGEEF